MGFFKKKQVIDENRSNEGKEKMRQLFNMTVADHEGYDIVYGFSSSVKTSNYILARKTTYTYTSLIIGFRESDMSIVMLQTTPDLDGCSDPTIFRPEDLKKIKFIGSSAQYTLYHAGGIMAGYTGFSVMYMNDDPTLLAYISQLDEFNKWDAFWEKLKVVMKK